MEIKIKNTDHPNWPDFMEQIGNEINKCAGSRLIITEDKVDEAVDEYIHRYVQYVEQDKSLLTRIRQLYPALTAEDVKTVFNALRKDYAFQKMFFVTEEK